MWTQQTNPDSGSLAEAKWQLRRWVVRQSVVAGILVWGAAFIFTQPSFGMGGPNYISATIASLVGAAAVALVAYIRAVLHFQRILATKEGSTLAYRLGKMFGGKLVQTERRRFLIRAPRPLWIGLAAVVVATGYGALSWHHSHSGPYREHGGVKYYLDSERAFAHATMWNKPVFVYFSGVTCTNARRMDRTVLVAPAVTKRLHNFICIEAFVDNVPTLADADRLLAQNVKLQDEAFGDVTLPAFVVLSQDFNLTREASRREPLAQTSGLILDEAIFVRFLDEAFEKWVKSR